MTKSQQQVGTEQAVSDEMRSLIEENTRLKLLLDRSRREEQAAMETAAEFERMMGADRASYCYSPKIEARREDYEKLAESLAHMIILDSARVPGLLDVESPNEGESHYLIDALDKHLYILWGNLDWHDARTIRRFYAEMRLYADQMASGFASEPDIDAALDQIAAASTKAQ